MKAASPIRPLRLLSLGAPQDQSDWRERYRRISVLTGAPPVVINAIIDALHPLGIEPFDMPATPSRVWQAIQSAKGDARAKSEAS